MERHRDNIHAGQMKISEKEKEEEREEEEEDEKHPLPRAEKEVEVTDLDIVTDYYNRLIIELSLQRYNLDVNN